MKIIIFLIYVVAFIMFLGCAHVPAPNNETSIICSDSINRVDSLINTKGTLLNNLILQIELFVTEQCDDEQTIVEVWCQKEKETNYISLITTNYYNPNNSEGVLIINDRLVVFSTSCIELGIVDTTIINKNNLSNFMNDNSQNNYGIFEPYVCKYIILENDSIELVFKGYF